MKKIRVLSAWLLAGVALVAAGGLTAQPTDNPYQTRYPGAGAHWTQQIRWDQVVNARQVEGLVKTYGVVDSVKLSATLEGLSAQGGGVLYFPAGTYYLHYDLQLREGVVLRGDAPAGNADARTDGFELPTRFVFPKYDVRAAGAYVPEATDKGLLPVSYPKVIRTAQAPLKNTGLVYLDINRATVSLVNKPFGAPMPRAGQLHKNLILLGLKVNNAVLPDPAIPTRHQVDAGHGMERWPWKTVGSINVTASENCVIAHCRLNDKPTDNFRQNGYLVADGMTLDGSQAMFRVTDHAGIAVNQPARTRAAAGKRLEITDTRVFLTEGNPAFLADANEVRLAGNDTVAIAERKNVVVDGLRAAGMDYDLLYNNLSLTQAGRFTNDRGDSLQYRLVAPQRPNPGEKYPLIVFLHDYEDRGDDNTRQLRHFLWQLATPENREKFPCYIVAPQLPPHEDQWKSRYNFAFTWSLQSCVDLVDSLIATHQIDPGRVYAMGAGTGGSAVWDLALDYPEKFAALVPMGGFFRFTALSAKQAAKVPMYVVWGDSDEWLSQRNQRLIMADLRVAGAKVKFKEFPDTGKKCWNTITRDVPEFLPWVFAQRK